MRTCPPLALVLGSCALLACGDDGSPYTPTSGTAGAATAASTGSGNATYGVNTSTYGTSTAGSGSATGMTGAPPAGSSAGSNGASTAPGAATSTSGAVPPSSTGATAAPPPGTTSAAPPPGTSGTPPASTGGGTSTPNPAYCDPVADWDPAWQAKADEALRLINELRAKGTVCRGTTMPPVGPLAVDPALTCSARNHCKSMVENEFTGHDDPTTGDGPTERIQKAGFARGGSGENVAWSKATAAETIEQWRTSPAGHCENMMRSTWKYAGLCYSPAGKFAYGHVWVFNVGG